MNESFLSRWARRKAAAQRPDASLPATDQKGPDQKAPDHTKLDQGPTEPVEGLPSLDTLGTESDYACFLRAGVSRIVQNQALAIAWASDPRIAGFRGMAEYDWDFNAVEYGRLGARDDVADLLRRIVAPGREPETLPPEPHSAPADPSGPTPSSEPAVAGTGVETDAPAASGAVEARDSEPRDGQLDQIEVAVAPAPNTPVASGRFLPRHGGALPS
jgi:hypothetical protein